MLAATAALPALTMASGGGTTADVGGPRPELLIARELTANYTPNIPIIDGELRPGEWDIAGLSEALVSEIPPAWQDTSDNITGEGIANDSDASHRIWAMYDEEYLYFAFNCSDDNITVPNYPALFWTSDGVEVCIDGALDGDEDQRTDEGFLDGDTFFVPADGRPGIAYSVALGSVHTRVWGRNDAWFSAVTAHEGYYIVEVEIKLSSIWSPSPTSTIGFNTAQRDNDDGNVTLEGLLRWQGEDGLNMTSNETTWGRVYLNTFVIADAGVPQDVNQDTVVTLDGRGSVGNHPSFGDVANYTWSFQYGGSTVMVYGALAQFLFELPGQFYPELSVTDGTGSFGTDSVRVGVRDTELPVVDAGEDMTVSQNEQFTFDASGTMDNDPEFPAGANYTWTLVDGDVVRLYGVAPSYTFRNAGEFVVRLQVTDASGNRGNDTVNITVRDIEPPEAVPPRDLTVDDRVAVTFDGSASTDNVGIAQYVWSFIISGEEVSVTGRTTAYTFPSPGTYVVNLTVHDYDGNNDSASFTVVVVDIDPPMVNVLAAEQVDEGVEITLDGTLSFDNIGIVEYQWTISLGGIVIDSPVGDKVRYAFAAPGLYNVTLEVTDERGLSSADTVQVRVRDVSDPHADAGPDRTVDEDATVLISGEASTDNVGVVEWNWTIERTGYPRVLRSGATFSYVFEEPGSYNITLTVRDAAHNWDSHFFTITVRDVTPPEAVPPRSLSIKVGQEVVFDGRASTDNVAIVRWVWNYTYLDVPVVVEGANITRVFESKGNYTIRLTVYDAAGNSHSKSFWVEVVKPKSDDGPGFGPAATAAAIAAAATVAVLGRRRRGAR